MSPKFPRPKPNPSAKDRHRVAQPKAETASAPSYGLARVLSKRGICSRTQAQELILSGRVRVNGRIARDPEQRTQLSEDVIDIDERTPDAATPVYLMMNKPSGLVTTASDEHERDTVYELLRSKITDQHPLPWVAPVGRLDKASEGLLLFSNDTRWASGITDPSSHIAKTYHVRIDSVPDAAMLQRLRDGISVDGEIYRAVSLTLLRSGSKNAWLEIVLDEGRNRQIRRMLQACDIAVLRLVRVRVGSLELGELPKGKWRYLTSDEMLSLTSARE